MASLNTTHIAARSVIGVMQQQGVTHVVACPGSRDTPLLIALTRCEDIETVMVVDERTAAFIALGVALQSGKPVGLVCTSGTALLNMSPAIAEALYRRVPLIVISADRPIEWIDQDDSQTIRQRNVLDNIVKQSYDLPATDTPAHRWYINRVANDAMITALAEPQGPVHINMQIDEPIGELVATELEKERVIRTIGLSNRPDDSVVRELAEHLLSEKRVMVIAGFSAPNHQLNVALNRLSSLSNTVVFTETISNLHGKDFVSDIDLALLGARIKHDAEKLRPDVVITTGGALVSRMIKEYVRGLDGVEHWHVGPSLTTVDCFRHLSLRIDHSPGQFFDRLSKFMERLSRKSSRSTTGTCSYGGEWLVVRDAARSRLQAFCAKAPWCDLKAFSTLIPLLPSGVNLQLSNGTPVRYAQLFGRHQFHRCDCNRGVSGIDGSTSTALGASLISKTRTTILITGDMSAQYDIGAFATGLLSPRFKVIVFCNGGGGIFHFIKSTRHLDIANQCFDAPCNFPAEGIANTFGLKFFSAINVEELREQLPLFLEENDQSAMLAIHTSGELSGAVLNDFFALSNPIQDLSK